MMSKIRVSEEHDGQTLNSSVAKAVACAARVDGAEIDVAVFAADCAGLASTAAELDGVSRVLTVERAENESTLAALLATQIVAMADDYTHLFGPSTTYGKDLMPRVAALLGVNQVSDIMEVVSSRQFKRPIYAGNAVVTVEAPADTHVVATARIASYTAVGGGTSATVESVALDVELPSHTRLVDLKSGSSDRPDLQTAPKVVSGGRALAS